MIISHPGKKFQPKKLFIALKILSSLKNLTQEISNPKKSSTLNLSLTLNVTLNEAVFYYPGGWFDWKRDFLRKDWFEWIEKTGFFKKEQEEFFKLLKEKNEQRKIERLKNKKDK